MRRWFKVCALLVPICLIGAAAWWLFSGEALLPSLQKEKAVAGSTMRVEHFSYTELMNGKPLYQLAGEEMHDEPARMGAMRVAALRVVKIKKVQLELLQPKVAGWLFTAEHGQLLAGNRQLSLWGHVHGTCKQGGTLSAGRLVVDPRSGVVKLRDGYVLDVGNRHERGVAKELGQ